MTTGIVLITQKDIGKALLAALKNTYDQIPLPIGTLCVTRNAEPKAQIAKLEKKLERIDQGHGVLILTDLYGSTPSNIAHALQKGNCPIQTKIVSGLNLPMLIKIMNYPDLSLDQLAQKAIEGGTQGITYD